MTLEQQQALALARARRRRAESEQSQQEPAAESDPSTAQTIAANPATRFAVGAAAPALGAVQRMGSLESIQLGQKQRFKRFHC